MSWYLHLGGKTTSVLLRFCAEVSCITAETTGCLPSSCLPSLIPIRTPSLSTALLKPRCPRLAKGRTAMRPSSGLWDVSRSQWVGLWANDLRQTWQACALVSLTLLPSHYLIAMCHLGPQQPSWKHETMDTLHSRQLLGLGNRQWLKLAEWRAMIPWWRRLSAPVSLLPGVLLQGKQLPLSCLLCHIRQNSGPDGNTRWTGISVWPFLSN